MHGANDAAATAQVDIEAALAWRDYMVSNYSDAVPMLAQSAMLMVRIDLTDVSFA